VTDTQVEQIVGNLLRAGVVLAASVVLAGGIWYLSTHGGTIEDYRVYHAQRETMPFTQGLAAPLKVIELGLLLLIATPVARVVFSVAAFWLQRDRVYVAITLLVLAILGYSLALS